MGEIFAGRYELADPIGRGGVGEVWRAWDHRRKRYVAAKVLQQRDAHTLLRFVREQALRIDHPHVLAPASWAADDDKVLFTMDLVSGGSLAHLIGDYGPLPPSFVCTLLDQLLSGLNAVHAEEVVHRDIKPANILLEPTGTGRPHVRLSDFGISMRKGEPRLTDTNYVVGTPGYFSPEQMRGAEPDFTADLYAVGLVGLYLLTGQKPDSLGMVERYENGGGVPSAPERVPEPLWQVLGTLLQPDPQARFRTATGARKALAGAAEMLVLEGTLEREIVEVFEHLGPLPEGFGPDGPAGREKPQTDAVGGAGAVPGATGVPVAPAASEAAQGSGVSDVSDVSGASAAAAGAPGAAGGSGTGTAGGTGTGAAGAAEASGTDGFPLAPPLSGTGSATGGQPQSPPPHPQQAHQAHQAPAYPQPASTPSGTFGLVPGGPPVAQPFGPPSAEPDTPPTPTQPYTTYAGQQQPSGTVPPPPPPPPPATAQGPVRRPGPSPKVAVTVLIAALLCFAVGIWALLAG
ncbi:serine/threonine protein kinase [Streptomyces sp. N2-109]|uniref:non-specific serine/threonine protein kinase n=1 Tax=Streptomyces gossypii TaxID=2883101 RepID=A0ABT2JMT5_9ACTN|nr:serine/threonine-protein kinase [Streptomyces gossypii]MCT2589185.1 serine/threonine protein kinase [Streptomyces gossypii]